MDLSPGQVKEQALRDGGFNDDEVNQWKSQASSDLQGGGFSGQEVRDYFGQKNFDNTDVKGAATTNIKAAQAQQPPQTSPAAETPVKPVEAKDVWESMKAAWGDSVLGTMQNHGKNPLKPSSDPSILNTLGEAVGQTAGDLPFMIAGSVMGEAATVAAGNPEAAPFMSYAGAFALPKAIRKMYIDHYQKGDITGPKDFMERLVGTTWEAAKGAATGVATAGSGGLGKAVAGTAGKLAAEGLAMTTVSSGLEGHLPEKKDFVNTAVALLGLHAVGATVGAMTKVPEKLSNIYAETGAHPAQVGEAAMNDVSLKQDLAADNPDLPKEAAPPTQDKEPTQAPKNELSDNAKGILEKIAPEPKVDKSKSISEKFNAIYAKEMDYTSTIKRVLKDYNGSDFLKDNPNNSYEMMRLFNAHMDKTREFMEVGTRDFKTGNTNGESYMDIIKDAQGLGEKAGLGKAGGVDLFNSVRLSRRAINYESRGFEHGFDIDKANGVIKDYPEMAGVVDRYNAFRNRLIDYVGDSGRYSKESIQAMKDVAGDSYAPLKRVFEPDPITGQTASGSKAIKKVIGSDRDVVNPVISDMRDISNMIRVAHETEATNKFISEVHDPEDPSDLIRVSENQGGLAAKTQIEGWDNGNRTLYDVPQEVSDSIKAMSGNRAAMGVWTSAVNGILKPFTVVQRGLTVNNPFFAVAHGWKQQWTAPTLSQTGLKLFQSISYAPEFLMGKYGVSPEAKESYHNFIYDGGGVNEIMRLDQTYLDKKIYEFDPKNTAAGKVWNTVMDYSSAAHWAISTHDNMIRYAEYSRMLDKGASRGEAAFAAREVLPDFQKQGLARSAYLNYIAFLPTHLNGISRAMQAGSEDVGNFKKAISGDMDLPTAIKTLGTGYFAKALAMYTTTSLLVKLAQNGDDELDDVNNFHKDNNWVIHAHDWRPSDLPNYQSVKDTYPSAARQMPDGTYQTDQGHFIRLPKPFTTGIFFGSGIEHVLDSWKGQNPNGWRDFASAVTNSIVPGEFIPTAGQPIIEGMTNHSFYTSQAVVSARAERFLPEYQYSQYTSETAKLISQMVSYVPGVDNTKIDSAPVIDNAIKTWGGTMGQLAIDQLDKGLIASGIARDKTEPISKLNKIPLLSRFMVAFPTSSPQSVLDFDERYKKADQVENTIQKLMKSGDVDEAVKVQNRYQVNMDRMRGVDQALQRMSMAIQKIDQSKDIPREQRQQLEESLMYGMAGIAKQGNKLMDEFEKRGK